MISPLLEVVIGWVSLAGFPGEQGRRNQVKGEGKSGKKKHRAGDVFIFAFPLLLFTCLRLDFKRLGERRVRLLERIGRSDAAHVAIKVTAQFQNLRIVVTF